MKRLTATLSVIVLSMALNACKGSSPTAPADTNMLLSFSLSHTQGSSFVPFSEFTISYEATKENTELVTGFVFVRDDGEDYAEGYLLSDYNPVSWNSTFYFCNNGSHSARCWTFWDFARGHVIEKAIFYIADKSVMETCSQDVYDPSNPCDGEIVIDWNAVRYTSDISLNYRVN